ncbi:hypothetical protein BJ912DRAFT_1146854 [Pholiota molesta]|nr:hypothetical protein BJ912DRAFT_1146854 [Pholiota molesta]
MADQPSVPDEPLPTVSVFNVGQTRTRQTNDGPNEARLLLQSYINALKSIQAKGYVVQGAMYGPEGANIFIDTDDEEWSTHVNI